MISMAQILQPASCGNVVLDHFTIEKNDIVAAIQNIPLGTYARLRINGEVAMSDTPMEYRTNSKFISESFGDVLIGGLGIGMVLMEIQNKDCIHSITVIEKSKDVIDIIASQLPLNKKVKIVNADVFDFKPELKYDVIYMDIWNYINRDVYRLEMKPLIAKYRRYLNPKKDNSMRGVYCWAAEEAKKGLRLI